MPDRSVTAIRNPLTDESHLAPYAARERHSRGRAHDETRSAYRREFQRDRDRIVHSAAFRRLEYKTQVFVNHEGDMFRTRLTHSIEVAQISRTVSRALRLNEDLTEAIALAHDLGHTPFGHAGQDALNACMREHGGFEHNLQSLRVVDVLEEKYPEFAGLNLTFETREGILKHCSRANARRLGDLGRRFLDGGQPGLEAQVANLADEIAYNNHDVDDGLRSGLISVEDLQCIASFQDPYRAVSARFPELPPRRVIHEVIRRMIGRAVADLIETSRSAIEAARPASIDEVRSRPKPLMRFTDEVGAQLVELKQFLRAKLYRHFRVHRMSVKATRIVTQLFEAFTDDARLLPDDVKERVRSLDAESGPSGRVRAVGDYVAGMTDRFAIAEHDRLFNPASRT